MSADRFRPDRGLTIRIAETWLLLLLITGGYGALLGLVLQWLVGVPWWVCLVLPVVATAALYARHEAGVLPKSLRTVPAEPEREPRLNAMVERLCALADVSRPQLKIIEVPWANALALQLPGRRPTIAVSRGMLDSADDARLEAVLAHELAHVIHRDAKVMTFATNASSSMLTLPAYLVDVFYGADRALCWLARQCGFGWRAIELDKHDKTPPARALPPGLRITLACTVMPLIGIMRVAVILLIFPFAIVALPTILLLSVPVVLTLTRLSRNREFAADRTAAMLTTQPMVLAATLTSLGEDGQQIPKKDLRELRAASSMAIIPLPTKGGKQKGRKKVSVVDRAVGSHPPINHRVKRLEELTRELAQ
ncbi:M48 family metalloprotease [Phytoactinopolyspora endophytica]|uniref:M48 family metalloprotease n=1 Tax=Phytoactinopolyspora endophytica TaxID=1642495 RepID=UPI0013EDC264|nr:M48 family metalloprotease [Phytoactinopolyspora endophytica]